MKKLKKNPWFHTFQPRPEAAKRLFCFPYAGGSMTAFRSWSAGFPKDIEVVAVQLPGRGSRFAEQSFTDLFALVDVLEDEIAPLLERPFAFFGHSMGGIIAFELARTLQRTGQSDNLEYLFISATDAPHLPPLHDPLYDLPEEKLKTALHEFNGTPQEVLEHEELLALMLPVIRADLSIYDTYQYPEGSPLNMPLIALGGEADPRVPVDRLSAWKLHTSALFERHIFPGDHFYLATAETTLLQRLATYLRS